MTTKIAIVGEAYGEQEALLKRPFVGASGQELTRMLRDAGINRDDCYITNCFNVRPPDNKIDFFFGTKKEGIPKSIPLRPGKYLLPKYKHEIDRLHSELSSIKPNITLALGATASWALLQSGKITAIRGFCAESTLVPGLKVLPTYHPAAVLRQWEYRPVVVADFMKGRLESEFPEIRRLNREVWIEPGLEDIKQFIKLYLEPAEQIAFDIETKNQTITCISFAPNEYRVITIPFFDERKPDWNYWGSLEEELEAWSLVRQILNLPSAKVAQNGLYDMQYLWFKMGIPIWNFTDDTMLLHHTLQPELPKGLGFLGSVYTNEAAWKTLRDEFTTEEEKPNE